MFSLGVHPLAQVKSEKLNSQRKRFEKPQESALTMICASISTDFPLATGRPVA